MPIPKLSPLQSRLAASLIASIMLLILYFAFSSPHFVYATNVDSIRPEDHNHEPVMASPLLEVELEQLHLEEENGYEGDFLGYDKGIFGRVPGVDDPAVLINNRPDKKNVIQGGLNSYSFLKASVLAEPVPYVAGFQASVGGSSKNKREEGFEGLLKEENSLQSRQSTRTSGTVYISVNTCSQPDPVQNTTVEPPPQLQLYVSTSEQNTTPGPTKDSNTQEMRLFEGGVVTFEVTATGDVFIGVYGEGTTAYTGVWDAEITVSIDGWYHTFHNETGPNLYLVDSDSNSALLVTGNLTNENSSSPVYQAWMNTPPPFTIFSSNKDNQGLMGLQNSYCALNLLADIAPIANRRSQDVHAVITNIHNGQPTQQFYIDSLSAASTYNIALGMPGNTGSDGIAAGGGGQVWKMTNFTTLSAGNCVLVYGLSFCSQTAYAVPGNPNTFPNATSLAAFYDNATQAQYQFFQNALAQTPCETTSSAQYSLARSCSDCEGAYKDWLCAVSIPRCTDWSSTSPWLQNRNMNATFPNGTSLEKATLEAAGTSAFLFSSRNPRIDDIVQPGPYKELLPCDDLCYNIVRSCPAALNFGCPRPGRIAFNHSYGLMPDGTEEQKGQITCNYPGADIQLMADGSIVPQPHKLVFLALVVVILMFT